MNTRSDLRTTCNGCQHYGGWGGASCMQGDYCVQDARGLDVPGPECPVNVERLKYPEDTRPWIPINRVQEM